MHLLITGATGYIGQHLVRQLSSSHQIRGVSLRQYSSDREPLETLSLQGVDAVIHLSGVVHQPSASDAEHQRINVDQTLQLARHAKASGVRQFVFFSSLAVYGSHGELGPAQPLTESSPCTPTSAYGRSKYQAEQALQALASEQFKVAIIRPPMVYGPGCPGNMARLSNLVRRLPVHPLGWSHNCRSLVSIDNLCAMTARIVQTQSQGIYLPQDPVPLSIAEICTLLSKAQKRPARLLPVPAPLIKLGHWIKPGPIASLFGSLYVDNRNSCLQLGFEPPQSTQQAFEIMCKGA